MNFLFATLLSCLFIFNNSPSLAEWTKASKSSTGDIFYVDLDSIKRRDGHVYFWELSDLVKPLGKTGAMSASAFYQVDCKLLGRKAMNIIFYKKSMASGNILGKFSPKNPGWDYPPPDSSTQSVLKSVCSRAK